jgi:hypothetical protein
MFGYRPKSLVSMAQLFTGGIVEMQTIGMRAILPTHQMRGL